MAHRHDTSGGLRFRVLITLARLARPRRVTLAVMKQREFFLWWIRDPQTGARRRTSYHMNREDAEARYPGAVPIPGTREVRSCPETSAEIPMVEDPNPSP